MDTSDMSSGSRVRSVTVADVARVLLYRWIALVVGAALGFVVVGGYVTLVSASYLGTADVVARPVVSNPFTYPSPGSDRSVNMNVESGIALGGQVVSAVASKIHVDQADVVKNLTVDVPVGGQILRFEYRGDSQDQAILAANTAADTYLSVRQQMYATQLAGVLKSYDTTIAKLHAEAKSARTAIAGLPSPKTGGPSATQNAAVEQLRGIDDQLTQLVSQRADIAATDITPGYVTSPAVGPLSSERNSPILLILAGLIGGLVLGAVFAYGWEAADRRVRSAQEARDITGLSMIGTIRRRGTAGRIDVTYVAHAIAQRADSKAGSRVVLISARPQEGGRLVAEIGVALAGFGYDVYVGTSGSRLNAARSRVKLGGPGGGGAPALPAPGTGDKITIPRQAGWAGMDDTAIIPALRDSSVSEGLDGDRGTVKAVATLPKAEPDGTIRKTAKVPMQRSHGSVRVGLIETAPNEGLVLLEAPSADTDDAGVREARDGVAVMLIARDHSRVGEVRRVSERLRAAGVSPVGFVFTRSGRA